jgi:hypothetical protein
MRTLRVTAAALALVIAGCVSLPHMLSPKRDMAGREYGNPQMPGKVLIGARRSEFKEAVIGRVADSLAADSVYVRVVGLRDLKEVEGQQWSAVVLVNSAMSWCMDYRVRAYLRRRRSNENVIVLTTSATGRWEPRKRRGGYDAVSAASEPDRVDAIAADLLARVRARMPE